MTLPYTNPAKRLDECCTLAQAAVVACALALHSRRPADMGRLSAAEWRDAVAATGAPAPVLPAPGGDAVLLRSGYAAHVAAARPPKDAQPVPLPDAWRPAERCVLAEVEYARGHWQRPTWQGRFAGSGGAGAAEDGLVIAWLLLERVPPPGAPPPPPLPAGAPEIDWSNFTFAHGFRLPRARPEPAAEGAPGGGAPGAGAGPGSGGAPDSAAGPAPAGAGGSAAAAPGAAAAPLPARPDAAASPAPSGPGGSVSLPAAAAAAAAAAVSGALAGREATPPASEGGDAGDAGGAASGEGTPGGGAGGGGQKRVLTRARRGKSSVHADFYMLDKGGTPVLSRKARPPCAP